MRPMPSIPDNYSRKWILRIIVIALIIIGAVLGLLFVLDSSGSCQKNPYFSKAKLKEDSISVDESTLVVPRVKNPTDQSYDNLKIQIATYSPKIKIGYGNREMSEQNGEYLLTTPIRTLTQGSKTGTYNFTVSGELYPGVVLMKVELNIRLLSGGTIIDEKKLELKIKE